MRQVEPLVEHQSHEADEFDIVNYGNWSVMFAEGVIELQTPDGEYIQYRAF